ncbi:uncharacterized protein [Misgurnus anguillicaudatus]|uniref:uncharacterized protein n=1 Tax=Misgurnus anguillicaudatus TaxID=75329 RepID=UPI003CCF83DF
MLKTLTETQKANWKESLNKLTFAYNSTRCEVTGFSPFYLLFGRSPRLPVDFLFGLTPEGGTDDHKEYVRRWRKGMQEAYEIVKENAKKSAERNKRNFEGKVRSSVLHSGDRVLIRNLTPRGGTGKLRNHWEDAIHTVVQRIGEGPVYEVKPERGKGRSRVLHRNLLLPCDYLPLEIELSTQSKTKRKMDKPADAVKENSGSEDEDEGCAYYYDLPEIQPRQPVEGNHELRDAHLPEVQLHQPEEGNNQPVEENIELENANLPAVQPDEPEKERDRVSKETKENARIQTENERVHQQQTGVTENEHDELDSMRDMDDLQSISSHGERQNARWPRRERRPPKTFTYDYLGTPICYNIEQVTPVTPQSVPYGTWNLNQWTNPMPPYAPVYLYVQ